MQLSAIDTRQAMYAAIIDNSQDAIISKDLTSRVTSWNKAAERMFGYTEAEMVGELIHKLIPEDRLLEEDEIIAALTQGKRIEHFETIRKTKDGRPLNISLTISPIIDATGKIVGASKIARDITEQVQAQVRLRILHEMGQTLAAKLDEDAILQLVTDATTKLSGAAFGAFFYNKVDQTGEAYMLYALSGAPREAFDQFGMPRNTAVFASTFDGIGIVRSDDITKDPRYGHNAPHKGMPEGHLPVVSYLAVPVSSQSGQVIGGLFFGHPKPGMFTGDHELLVSAIAAQAAVSLNNARLYQEVTMLNAKKDEFIGFASHELKTPIATIKGFMQLGKAANLSCENIYPKVIKQIDRLEVLVSDLLDLSRIQAGKFEYKFEKVSLLQLVNEAVDSVDTSAHTIKSESPVSDIKATGDYSKLLQVLVNLVSNACKYAPPATTIYITSIILGDLVQVSVADEGPGIPVSEQTHIFNQFYRVSTDDQTKKGTGLGLYISKEIMEAHEGKIWVESEPGKGATFHISFPINRAEV